MDVLKFFLTRSQVRGTPGTGKTSLAELPVIWMHGWPYDDVKSRSRKRCFEIEKGLKTRNHVFIFDEAQRLSYVDGELWNNFFKSIHIYSNCRAITFTSYVTASSVQNAELGQVLFSVRPKRNSKMNFTAAALVFRRVPS